MADVTIADVRGVIVTALEGNNLTASSSYSFQKAPCIVVGFGSADPRRTIARKLLVNFNLTLIAGAAIQANSAAQLDAMTLSAIDVLRDTAGIQLGAVSSDLLRAFPIDATPDRQVTYLTRDVAAAALVDIA